MFFGDFYLSLIFYKIVINYNQDKYFFQRNFRNDIIAIYDSNNSLVAKYVYDATGTENNSATFIGNINPFRYRGYYFDIESKLYYCIARYYNPEIGRWMCTDVLEYLNSNKINGLNLFVYCDNNPVCKVDSTGNDAIYVTLYKFNEGGLPIVGHARIYYQDEDGDWRCTEYGGKFPFKSSAEVYDYDANMSSEELLEMLESYNCDYTYFIGNFSSIESYTSGLVGDDLGGYNLFSNNCLHYVRNVLKNTGVILDNDTIIPVLYHPYVRIIRKPLITKRGKYEFANSGSSSKCYFDDKLNLMGSLLARYKI